MRLVSRRPQGSFYESFSDLIFNTLTLMLVIVMALVLQLKDAAGPPVAETRLPPMSGRSEFELEPKLDPKPAPEPPLVDQVLHVNQFTGAGERTVWYLAYLRRNGGTFVAWLPAGFASWLHVSRFAENPDPFLVNNPIRDVCEYWRENGVDGLRVEDFLAMEDDLGYALLANTIVGGELNSALALLSRLEELDPGMRRTSVSQLQARIGGIECQYEKLADQDLRRVFAEHSRWLEGDRGQHPMYEGDVLLARRLSQRPSARGAFVRFRVANDKTVQVGRTSMSSRTFRNMLRSITPGRGFRLEFVGTGGREETPPNWVVEEILIPAGITARIPR